MCLLSARTFICKMPDWQRGTQCAVCGGAGVHTQPHTRALVFQLRMHYKLLAHTSMMVHMRESSLLLGECTPNNYHHCRRACVCVRLCTLKPIPMCHPWQPHARTPSPAQHIRCMQLRASGARGVEYVLQAF